MEILLPRMKYTHEIVGTHGGALLPERAPGACSGSKTPRVYRPLFISAMSHVKVIAETCVYIFHKNMKSMGFYSFSKVFAQKFIKNIL